MTNSPLCYKLMPLLLGALGFLFGFGCYFAEVFAPQMHNHFFYWSVFFTIQVAVGVVIGWLIRRLYFAAFTDGLTGLWNYRYFYNNVKRRLDENAPFTLVYLDLDNFKSINDLSGHQSGDNALRELAATLRSNCRSTDLIARLGGDEFAILLPDTSYSDALKIAERVRQTAEKQFQAYNATISAGVACSWQGASAEQLIMLADRALYKAKNGKNRVFHLMPADAVSCDSSAAT